MENSNCERLSARQCVILVALMFLQVCVGFVLVLELLPSKEPRVPMDVKNFLDTYLCSQTIESGIFDNLFDTDIDQTEEDYREIFKLWVPGAAEFEYEAVSDTFLIVRCYSDDGELVAPPLGMWYEYNAVLKRVRSYTLAGLQPFSRYDEEYSTLWQGLYGYD